MKWLPSRAYDNGIYAVFSNPIGMDDDQLKNGCSMIIDPFGDIIAECRKLGDDYVSAVITPEKLKLAGGYRCTQARRPDLYRDIIGQPHKSEQKVVWLNNSPHPNPFLTTKYTKDSQSTQRNILFFIPITIRTLCSLCNSLVTFVVNGF